MKAVVAMLVVVPAFVIASHDPFGMPPPDVTISKDKLSDFSTTFSSNADGLFPPFPGAPKAHLHGEIAVNVKAQQVKISLDVSAQAPAQAAAQAMGPFGGIGMAAAPDAEQDVDLKLSYNLVFDGVQGSAGLDMRVSGNDAQEGSATGAACLSLNFDPKMVPPPAMLEGEIDQALPMVNGMANMIPHSVVDGVAYYTDCDGMGCAQQGVGPEGDKVFALRASEGTPVGIWALPRMVKVEDAADATKDVPALLKFGDWKASGDFTPITCTGPNQESELLANPHAQWALLVADQLIMHLSRVAPLQPFTSHIPKQMVRLLSSAAEVPTCKAPAVAMIEGGPIQQFGAGGMLAMCAMSAIVGAGVVFGAMLSVWRKSAPAPVYLEIS